MGKDFFISISKDSPRAENFRKVFGRLQVNIESPIPQKCRLPGFDEPQMIYRLDLAFITPEERTRLVADISERFKLTVQAVEIDLAAMGMPIKAGPDAIVIIENPTKWIDNDLENSALDQDEEYDLSLRFDDEPGDEEDW